MKTYVSFERLGGDKKRTHITYESTVEQENAHLSLNDHQANKKKYNFYGDGQDGMRKVASFSPWAQMLWLNHFGYSPLNPKNLRRTLKDLNDPEWRRLKTSSEKL